MFPKLSWTELEIEMRTSESAHSGLVEASTLEKKIIKTLNLCKGFFFLMQQFLFKGMHQKITFLLNWSGCQTYLYSSVVNLINMHLQAFIDIILLLTGVFYDYIKSESR